MIIVTGATGFIGSHLVRRLVAEGIDVLAVTGDHGTDEELGWHSEMHKSLFQSWLKNLCSPKSIDAIVHLGACTDTKNTDWPYLLKNNTRFSADIWEWCAIHNKKLVYASSAATYGDGCKGFSDDHSSTSYLWPLNKYGWSKHAFDLWTLGCEARNSAPPSWAGLKFFNVYGPGEAHKGPMASMVYQAFWQAQETGKIKLFSPGDQKRDFVFVGDVVDVIVHMLGSSPKGLYNVGSGTPRSFSVMAASIFGALGFRGKVEYFEMPKAIRKFYQDYTCADLFKLGKAGWKNKPTSLEQGILSMTK